jgi:hypothetical protein
MNLGDIIAALHDSEINGEVSWFLDDRWRVKLGDPVVRGLADLLYDQRAAG